MANGECGPVKYYEDNHQALQERSEPTGNSQRAERVENVVGEERVSMFLWIGLNPKKRWMKIDLTMIFKHTESHSKENGVKERNNGLNL